MAPDTALLNPIGTGVDEVWAGVIGSGSRPEAVEGTTIELDGTAGDAAAVEVAAGG